MPVPAATGGETSQVDHHCPVYCVEKRNHNHFKTATTATYSITSVEPIVVENAEDEEKAWFCGTNCNFAHASRQRGDDVKTNHSR